LKPWHRKKKKKTAPSERDPLEPKIHLELGDHPIIARKDIGDLYQKP
jgi:hypothetical protein